MLIAVGDQGSSKTVLSKAIKRLLDPAALETVAEPTNAAEFLQQAARHHVLFLDNLSRMRGWLSDAMCRVCTGDGTSKRRLYTDDDDVIYTMRRCVGFNGIGQVASCPDLLDRALIFEFERVPSEERVAERELWRRFQEALPGILGGLFDLAATAMKVRPEVSHTRPARLGDFAIWGRAVAVARGLKDSDFDDAFVGNVERQDEQTLDSSPIAQAIRAFAEENRSWVGKPIALLEALREVADKHGISTDKQDGWPQSPHWLS